MMRRSAVYGSAEGAPELVAPVRPSALSRVFLANVAAALHPSRIALRLGSLVGSVALWELLSQRRINLRLVDFTNVPAPSAISGAALQLLGSPKLIEHVTSSLARVFGGFAAAAAIGIALGLWIGRSRTAADLFMPGLEVVRPIPAVAWIPLAILMFPSAELSMMFITFLGALFPILLSTIHGVEALDRRLIAAAQCLGAGRTQIFREVVLPGALPSVITGLSIGMGTSWFCLVTAEMMAGQYGIGYYTWESYNLQRYPEIVLGMLLIGGFGMGSSVLVKRAGAALTPWYRLHGSVPRVD
jgi:NitT/TauT family transport system permease protein